MILPDWARPQFADLAEERRRIAEEFDTFVARIDAGGITDIDRATREAQSMSRRHQAVIENMLALLQY